MLDFWKGNGQRTSSSSSNSPAALLTAFAVLAVLSSVVLVATKSAMILIQHIFVALIFQNAVSLLVISLVMFLLPAYLQKHQQVEYELVEATDSQNAEERGVESPRGATTEEEKGMSDETFLQVLLKAFPSSIIYCISFATMCLVLKFVPLSTFIALHAVSIIPTVIFSWLLVGKVTGFVYQLLPAMIVCGIGAAIYGSADIRFSWTQYSACFLHFTSLSLSVFVSTSKASRVSSPLLLTLCHHLLSLVFLLFGAYLNSELQTDLFIAACKSVVLNRAVTTWTVVNAVGVLMHALLSSRIESQTSPISLVAMNNLSKIPAIFLGLVFFSEQITLTVIISLVTSIGGGLIVIFSASDNNKNENGVRLSKAKRVFPFVVVLIAALVLFAPASFISKFDQMDSLDSELSALSTDARGEVSSLSLGAHISLEMGAGSHLGQHRDNEDDNNIEQHQQQQPEQVTPQQQQQQTGSISSHLSHPISTFEK